MSLPTSPAGAQYSLRFALVIVTAFGLTVLAAGCAGSSGDWPVNISNEAYPQPPPDGFLSTPSFAGIVLPDTGNVARSTSPRVGSGPVIVGR